MGVEIKPRKGPMARHLADERPDLAPRDIAKIVGTNKANVVKALKRETFGKDVRSNQPLATGEMTASGPERTFAA